MLVLLYSLLQGALGNGYNRKKEKDTLELVLLLVTQRPAYVPLYRPCTYFLFAVAGFLATGFGSGSLLNLRLAPENCVPERGFLQRALSKTNSTGLGN